MVCVMKHVQPLLPGQDAARYHDAAKTMSAGNCDKNRKRCSIMGGENGGAGRLGRGYRDWPILHAAAAERRAPGCASYCPRASVMAKKCSRGYLGLGRGITWVGGWVGWRELRALFLLGLVTVT